MTEALLLNLLAKTLFGALAAVGFGVLFNFKPVMLAWCAASGALALFVRTSALEKGWALEAASFAAAISVSVAALMLRRWLRSSNQDVALCGCIPMVPGAFMSKAILGFVAITGPHADADTIAVNAMQDSMRVLFTLCAIGTGLVLPVHLSKSRSL